MFDPCSQGGLVWVPVPVPDVPLPLPLHVPAQGQGQEPPRHLRRELRRGLLRRIPLHPLRQLPGELGRTGGHFPGVQIYLIRNTCESLKIFSSSQVANEIDSRL